MNRNKFKKTAQHTAQKMSHFAGDGNYNEASALAEKSQHSNMGGANGYSRLYDSESLLVFSIVGGETIAGSTGTAKLFDPYGGEITQETGITVSQRVGSYARTLETLKGKPFLVKGMKIIFPDSKHVNLPWEWIETLPAGTEKREPFHPSNYKTNMQQDILQIEIPNFTKMIEGNTRLEVPVFKAEAGQTNEIEIHLNIAVQLNPLRAMEGKPMVDVA